MNMPTYEELKQHQEHLERQMRAIAKQRSIDVIREHLGRCYIISGAYRGPYAVKVVGIGSVTVSGGHDPRYIKVPMIRSDLDRNPEVGVNFVIEEDSYLPLPGLTNYVSPSYTLEPISEIEFRRHAEQALMWARRHIVDAPVSDEVPNDGDDDDSI